MNIDFPFEIIRSKRRKTMAIKVLGSQVQVILPHYASQSKAMKFLQQQQAWVRKKLDSNAKPVAVKPNEYSNGEIFSYLGKKNYLKVLPHRTPEVQ